MAYDVFISFKNNDDNGKPTKESVTAKKLYDFLTAKGLRVFFSNVELEFLGTAQYMDAITEALDSSIFLIAVGSSHDNLNSKWVKSEWSSFLNDIYSNIKPNAAVFVLCDGMNMHELPRALRQQQAFDARDSGSFDKLYNFIYNAINRIGSGSEESRLQGTVANPYAGASSGTVTPVSQNSRIIIITGILTGAAALIILAVLLVPGWLRQKPVTESPPTPYLQDEYHEAASTPSPTVSPVIISPTDPPTQGQPMSAEQQALLDNFAQKFQEVLPDMIDKIMISNELFIAAAGQAFYTDPVFSDHGLTVTLMLPDPGAASLDNLGIVRYTPHSGAQAYIRDNYEKLCRMEGITDWLEYPVTFQLEKGLGGENIVDPSLFSLSSPLYEYSNAFLLHVDQYMKDMGFYEAALELLMPVTGDWDSALDYEAGYIQEYFDSLTDALEFKGIEVDGNIVADKAIIRKMLEERLARVWACNLVSVYTNTFQQPQLKMRSLSGGVFFSRVHEKIDADFTTGRVSKPRSFDEFELLFLSNARELANGVLESTATKDSELYVDREYPFDWASLGAQGLASCTDLVEEMRSFLFSYDFDLRFLATWHGISN